MRKVLALLSTPCICWPLTAIYNLDSGQNLFFYINHPIQWIRLVGVIVAVDVYPTRWIMLLDDSSGATIEITCGRPKLALEDVHRKEPSDTRDNSSIPESSVEGLTVTGRSIDLRVVDIGKVVKVKGGLGIFRGEKQLLLERITVLHTTNEEAASWAESTAFRREILSIPWAVSKKDEERARKKAEGLCHKPKATETCKRNVQANLKVREKSNHMLIRRADARKKNENNQKADHAALGEEEIKYRQIKRNEEKRLRQEEFAKMKRQQENVKSYETEHQANGEEQIHRVLAMNHNGKPAQACSSRIATLSEKREQAKLRRAEERRLRELEFEKLKRIDP